jgi:glutamate dehydrogenase (NAD(P)+)
VVYTIRETLKHLKLDAAKMSASVQGFGNVAQYAARGFTEQLGGTVDCVSWWDNKERRAISVSSDKGLDIAFLQSITDQYGDIDQDKAQEAGYKLEDADAWLSKDVDILIPAALEGQLNGETVHQISDKVKILAEGANGPTTQEADAVLNERGVFTIPDFLCNAGGVTVSYFESVQNDMNYYCSKEEVLDRLDLKMTEAYRRVLEMSANEGVPMRDAAYMVGISAVVEAMEMRGWL